MICPGCQLESLVPAKVNYPIKDSMILNVPVLRCDDCGEMILAEEDLTKIMNYISRPGHIKEVDWSELA